MDYSALASRVLGLINTYGGDAIITKTSLGTYSTTTNAYSQTETTTTCKAVSRQSVKSVIPSGLAAESDEDFIFPYTAYISPNDVITFGGVKSYVKKVIPIAPGGTVVIYKVWSE